MKRIAILNGPNLDRLGKREPEIYGSTTLPELEEALRVEFGDAAELLFFQSNHEGALIDRIAAWADAKIDGLVINGGAFTHTSVALRDALAGAKLRTVEVHISNLYQREEFRHRSLTAPLCVGVVTGLGLEGYFAAVRFLLKS
jgi:3-dehydroquinate dehydratase II